MTRTLPVLLRFVLLFAVLMLAQTLRAEETPAGPGTKIETLTVGTTTYRQVQVRSVNARTVMITHSGGMTSLRLRDLPPEWRERFGYDPAAEAAAEEAARNAPPRVVPRVKPAVAARVSKYDALLLKFGQPASVETKVDMRPSFFKLELNVKNQGHRPSCAVFAIVSALELQNAELAGQVEKFSEEYLIWATRKTTQRMPAPGSVVDPNDEERDEGFALFEVVAALRAYGIPLQATMPNTFGRKIEAIEDPSPAIVEEARKHQRVFVHSLPGRDNTTRLNNLVHALNGGLPVPVGMTWPGARIFNGFISGQKGKAGSGHAVTMVGYLSSTGRIEDAVFIFKNSWGPNWGQGGYGTVTYSYLSENLNDAVILEIMAGKSS